jgi:light-regulated signal transduction histidine kinase (bacteriophytochrome)/CheY-like chemotaxis protein
LNARDDEGVFASDRMAEIFPGVGADAAGVLALSVSRTPKDWILWFRREIVDTVTWAGNPNKAVDRAPGDGRLTPRESFRAWRETVRGRSRPWKPLEIEAAQSLRLAILEVVLQRIDQLARARAEAHEQQTLLLAELDHRVKNMLANIRAVMRFTRRSNDTLDSYVENLDRRVKSMAHAQSLLSASRWRGAELRRLVDEELRAYEGADRAISIEGPTIELTPKAALSISMVLHELATNAAKYGSLSSAGGRLAVRWTLDDAGLRLAWRETGGPTVRRPERRGFGRMLVETSVAYELEGEVDLRFEPEGVACDVAIPSHFVLTPALPHSRRDVGAGAAKPAAVLVVEDSMITALDLADTLEAAGYRPIGPTGRVEDALVMVDQEAPDVAVLDVNLGDTTSFPVADRLADKRIPFVFLTGYDPNGSVPARFAEVPCLAKPCSDEELRTALTRALGR